jgi:hypothetical protein
MTDAPLTLADVVKQRDDLLEVCLAYETWEALLILESECWDTPDGLPRFSEELWESWLVLQTKRGKVISESLPHSILQRTVI